MTSVGNGLTGDKGLSEAGLGRFGEGLRVASLLLQLGLALALSWALHIESPAFYLRILPLAIGGAIVNHLLPLEHRPSFFAALGIYGILLVFGIGPGGWMVGLGLTLIGLCHLPISFRLRVLLISLVGVTLMAMRAGWIKTPWPGVIWPIFASMFMFRLGLYLYDLKHYGPMRPDLVLSYFFLLPNVVFLLFPVLDFHTYRRTYYDRKPLDIYEVGAQWILRGLTHLVLYRLIYTYVAISPAEVVSTATLVRYLLGNYGLYLRVSGQFHVIVGLLHLFGFRLPETHRFFYLASSFSDFWRRMNIYWKDFMQRMVYLPAALGLKRWGETPMLIGAILCVLVASWFLRSYQWFWLVGTWLFSATDIVFWGILGTFLMVNSLLEQRRGRARQLIAHAPTGRGAWREAAQTAGMFGLMSVLWGFWTSPTFGDFRALLGTLTLRPMDFAAVAATLIVVGVVAFVSRRLSLGTPSELTVRRWWQHPLLNAALPLGLLWALGEPAVSARIPAGMQEVARQARTIELNKYDAERLQRGYYEKIVGVNRFNGELWEVYARAGGSQPPEIEPLEMDFDASWPEDPDAALQSTLGVSRVDGPLEWQLRPLVGGFLKGGRFSTNSWGMRDREYDPTPPPATRRLAFLGPSNVMGSGVNDGETFEALVEDQLNREWQPKTGLHYEILNFGVSNYSLAQQVLIMSNGRVARFHPDIVLVAGNPSDPGMLIEYFWRRVQHRDRIPPPIVRLINRAGVANGMVLNEAQGRLEPYSADLLRWAMKTMASEIDRIGAQAIYVLLPSTSPGFSSDGKAFLLSMAQETGFIVIDLSDAFDGQDYESLILSPADRHPNKSGHQIMAARLYSQLIKEPSVSAPDGQTETTKLRALAGKATLTPGSARDLMRPPANGTKDSWSIDTHEENAATLEHSSTEPGRMRVSISAPPRQVPWHVKLSEGRFQITGGSRYLLKFRARADAPRMMTCAMGQNTSPWELLASYLSVGLTPEWKAFTCSFVATRTELNARIFFDLGQSDAAVELSDVVLQDLSAGRDLAPESMLDPIR